MKYVLGIDAAWTAKEPSGLALLELQPNNKPKIITISRSYNEFFKPDIDFNIKSSGSTPNVNEIIKYAKCADIMSTV